MLTPGDRLGPYEVVSPLGTGGMGEVYRARDTRLGREVALKVLPEAVATDPDRLKRFEREARATAALSHPNVLTVFDVGADDGRAFVVTELLEGSTLGARLRRGALPVREALALAAQAARGLAAAHARGIVHRDLKPDNLFLTTSGTLKILDFGLARLEAEDRVHTQETTEPNPTSPGTVLGTVSYMSPEQAKGLHLDSRSDLFALGVVLYEMLSGRHPFKRTSSAETVSAILRDEPPDLGVLEGKVPGAVQRLARRCLEKRPEDRFQTAGDLALALDLLERGEETAPSPGTAGSSHAATEEERPYPGLSSFTEADAAHFFGREDEVRALWEKIRRRELLAVIGPSGVGKTSFLRAGILARKPTGWAAVYCTPGTSPVASLARALSAPRPAGDSMHVGDAAMGGELVQAVADFLQHGTIDRLVSVARGWRSRRPEALVVVDALEELFTQSPRDAQERFAALLARLAHEADVHVLVSLRDDFLFRCHGLPGLDALFRDLTPLGAPSPDALRRAIVEPAARLGFRFEDRSLVDEMVGAVAGERGALPLVAFAVSRLWDERDRERRLVTREAYQRIGGVGGALAKHAEATLQALGSSREPVVRRIFRELVTAEGTRTSRDREEILSVFDGEGDGSRREAAGVLDALVAARLLTEFEDPCSGAGVPRSALGTTGQRIEVAHESLLTHWPRLARWRTQDEGSAQLRDQLRQAARVWQVRGRPDELLWTGASYLDYRAWRARNASGLSTTEEDFARSMAAHAERRRRRQRALAAAVLAGALGLSAITSILWLQAVRSREAARAESRQREAAEILAVGRLQLGEDPGAALAHAIASLEKADSEAARRFAVEALWQGPIPRWLPGMATSVVFSPDGRWLATSAPGEGVWLYDGGSGARRRVSPDFGEVVGFTGDGETLVTVSAPASDAAGPGLSFRATSSLEVLRSVELPPRTEVRGLAGRSVVGFRFGGPDEESAELVRHEADAGQPTRLGLWRFRQLKGRDVDETGRRLASVQGDRILVQSLDRLGDPPREIGRGDRLTSCCGGAWTDRVVSGSENGELRVWHVAEARLERTLRNPAGAGWAALAPGGRWLAASPSGAVPARGLQVFELTAPRDAESLPLASRRIDWLNWMAFDPTGRWLATGHSEGGGCFLWPLGGPRPHVLRGQKPPFVGVAFTPDGKSLVSTSEEGVVRSWSLTPDGPPSRALLSGATGIGDFVTVEPGNRYALVATRFSGEVLTVPLAGGPARRHAPGGGPIPHTTIDPSGRWAALASTDGVILLDLSSGRSRLLKRAGAAPDCTLIEAARGLALPLFLPDGRLISTGADHLRLWDLEDGSSRVVRPCEKGPIPLPVAATPDSRTVLLLFYGTDTTKGTWPALVDLEAATLRQVTSHGSRFPATVRWATLDPTGRLLVTGDQDGLVRVGVVSGEEPPHLLFGHTRQVTSVAVSPDGRWIASGSDDGTIRLWPMPDLTRPPLHTLPHEELLGRLRSVTNLRVVSDRGSASGYKVEAGPFAGWGEVPTW